MQAAQTEPDVVIPDMATIDTDTGVIRDAANLAVSVTSSVVTQDATTVEIRVFVAKSFKLSKVLVKGSRAVAFVSPGEITVDGVVDASADGAAERAGPGQQTSGTCVGESVGAGGAGGGNATPGGRGLNTVTSIVAHGGAAQVGDALAGGCVGGNSVSDGLGGGAVQMVSQTAITLSAMGAIDVGGGGGGDRVGGGSGGLVILESPHVAVLGAVTANGGAGGACGSRGDDGSMSLNPAMAPGGCGTNGLTHAGGGGSVSAAPTDGTGVGGGGGGGGAVGRLLVTTAGQLETGAATLISAQAKTTALNPL